jgi:membrane-bound metal-dependent hydrolase YbcI (DUF457 family)
VPVTPFHFGPGILLKALLPTQLSATAFMGAQIAIDLESAYYLFIARQWPVHRWAHTFLAASAIGILVGVTQWVVGAGLRKMRPSPLYLAEVAWWPCLVGGFLGGVTHPLFDGIMHDDIQPFRPFTEDNPLLGLVGLGTLHLFCMLAGAAGGVLLLMRRAPAGDGR